MVVTVEARRCNAPLLGAVAVVTMLAVARVASSASPPDRPPDSPAATFVLDGDPREWQADGTAIPLLKTRDDAGGGTIWVRSIPEGVLVGGEIGTAGPDTGHIDVWMAPSEEPRLPPIGWGDQFGYEALGSERDCENSQGGAAFTPEQQQRCKDWFRAQVAYRDGVRKLFLRHWQVSRPAVVEVWASPAFDALTPDERKNLDLLRPTVVPSAALVAPHAVHAFTFELLIPWDALPPVSRLDLDEVEIRVDVVRATGTTATTSDAVAAGRTDVPIRETLSTFRFPQPRRYFITPCRYQLRDAVMGDGSKFAGIEPSKAATVLFVPTVSLDVRRAIVIDNEAHGYLYLPDPKTRSPIASAAEFFAQDVGGGSLCGPRLAYADGRGVVRSEFLPYALVRPTTKSIGKGGLLIEHGPYAAYSHYGSGECGACPRAQLAMTFLSFADRTFVRAFDLEEVVDTSVQDLDLVVDAGWRKITVLRGSFPDGDDENARWTATVHCWREERHRYEKCGERDSVPAPTSRSLVFSE